MDLGALMQQGRVSENIEDLRGQTTLQKFLDFFPARNAEIALALQNYFRNDMPIAQNNPLSQSANRYILGELANGPR